MEASRASGMIRVGPSACLILWLAMILVFSSSLRPHSRSRMLAAEAARHLAGRGVDHELVDLARFDLPACDGHDCYSHPEVGDLSARIGAGRGILLAAPVYNYDVSATAKNLVELTGSAWNDKVVGLMCAAGGQGSYMAPLGLANSLMLDFRCLVLPGYVFADETGFDETAITDERIPPRIHRLADQLVTLAGVWPEAAGS